jgi:hypothetical protein
MDSAKRPCSVTTELGLVASAPGTARRAYQSDSTEQSDKESGDRPRNYRRFIDKPRVTESLNSRVVEALP